MYDIIDFLVYSLYSFIASLAFGIQFNIKFKHITFAGIGGVVSQLIYMAIMSTGISEALACFFGAISISLYAEILAKRLRVPVNMYLVVGIIPLVPGGYIYYTMVELINGEIDKFFSLLLQTIAIAGAIAMGVFAVSSVTRFIRAVINTIFLKTR